MTETIDPQITMGELVSRFPGAQRALFRSYHVGGCSSCGFKPDETLAQVCARNENLPVADVTQTILAAHDADQRMQIAPVDAAELVKAGKARLIDVRSQEEWDSVHIEGSTFFTQELMQQLGGLPQEQLLIFVCHHGVRSLDAAAYFAGHGIENVRSLRGGIDAWSCEVDPALPRYELA
ncbi:MAG: rhodanese-like domain-containing protein [Chthoniobacteraceae bacterium]